MSDLQDFVHIFFEEKHFTHNTSHRRRDEGNTDQGHHYWTVKVPKIIFTVTVVVPSLELSAVRREWKAWFRIRIQKI